MRECNIESDRAREVIHENKALNGKDACIMLAPTDDTSCFLYSDIETVNQTHLEKKKFPSADLPPSADLIGS